MRGVTRAAIANGWQGVFKTGEFTAEEDTKLTAIVLEHGVQTLAWRAHLPVLPRGHHPPRRHAAATAVARPPAAPRLPIHPSARRRRRTVPTCRALAPRALTTHTPSSRSPTPPPCRPPARRRSPVAVGGAADSGPRGQAVP